MNPLSHLTRRAGCGNRRMLVGGVQVNPETELFQLWLLPENQDITSIRAFETFQAATDCYLDLRRAFASGKSDVMLAALETMNRLGFEPTSFPNEFAAGLREQVRAGLRRQGIQVSFPTDVAVSSAT
jgi:hypothetical protein